MQDSEINHDGKYSFGNSIVYDLSRIVEIMFLGGELPKKLFPDVFQIYIIGCVFKEIIFISLTCNK